MKVIKFVVLWIVLTLVMLFSWSLGISVGNAVTSSRAPEPANPADVASAFLTVCVIESLFVSMVIWRARVWSGKRVWLYVILFFWGMQFVLTQMETWFFVVDRIMSLRQIVAVVIAGAVMSCITIGAGALLVRKMATPDVSHPLTIRIRPDTDLWLTYLILIAIVYPFLYLTFGYFVAWQSDAVRMYYSQSTVLDSFFVQTAKSFADGVYAFQVLRGAIWVMLSVPFVILLQDRIRGSNAWSQYLLVAMLFALPAILLIIPNPYMPAEVAFAHLAEVSLSNFLWGLAITFFVNRAVAKESIALRT